MIDAIAAHLWQSTLFAAAAALLTLAFRASQARVRYWIWLTASLKFLLPFALLTSLGSHIHIRTPSAVQEIATTVPVFSYTLGYLSGPVFPQVPGYASSRPTLSIDVLIFGLWGCGVISLALTRLRGWRRIRRVVRASLATDIPVPVEVRSSPGLSEPGVVGLIRPVLLLPQGITERLTPSEMDAILAHELCHVRRRDNLLAFPHMVAETMFWFHPLMWWIGARLLEERERACDEDVLSRGARPDVYADAILSVCRLYVESPRLAACGVTGATLKRRIEIIMSNRVAEKLNGGRKILLAAAGAAAVAMPMLVGSLDAPRLSAQTTAAAQAKFEVASIKPCVPEPIPDGDPGRGGGGGAPSLSDPGMFRTLCMPARALIQTAYVGFAKAQRENPIQGGPDWINSARFIVVAKPDTPQPRSTMAGPMLRALLEDRFKLKVHRETKKVSAYELVVGRGGSKLQATPEGGCTPPEPGALTAPVVRGKPLPCHYGAPDANGTKLVGATMDSICQIISAMVLRDVIDKTGLTGLFDANLEFDVPPPGALANDGDLAGEALAKTTAALRKLGLELKSTTGDAEFVVIDHIERPTEN
jgi:bla regulator protein BlaR1